MYKIKNKISGAESQVTDAAWAEMKTKKVSEDPQEKKTWAQKYKVIEHQPDIEQPQASFIPPEIQLPEMLSPSAEDKGSKRKATK